MKSISQSDDNQEFASKQRQYIFYSMVILFAVSFIIRLIYLQIVTGNQLRQKTETQAIKEQVIEPYRGNIFDRYGRLMVHNEPSFSVTLTPNDFKREALPLLFSILELDTNFIMDILSRNDMTTRFTPFKIYRDLDPEKLAYIEENSDFLPGIDVVAESKRLYEFPDSINMAHLLGYTREVTWAQLEKKKYYRSGDIIGQTGLENSYEDLLFGNKGFKYIAVNRLGKKVSDFDNGKKNFPARNGSDLYLSIDKDMQCHAEKLLANHRGAVVAIDPNNGEILTLASKPDFDLRQFRGKIDPVLYKELSTMPGNPFYNRAVQAQYPPGSTWKMLVAIAALQEGIINENTTLFCGGSITLGNRTAACHGGAHGSLNVVNAIKASCNVFFYRLALMVGMENIEKYGKMLGFGTKVGIDIPSEKNGLLPTMEWLRKNRGIKNKVPDGMLINYGIGQGEILVTPLQMASYAATIANGGTVYQPHIVRQIKNSMTNKLYGVDLYERSLGLRPDVIEIVKKGMFSCVNLPGGTGHEAQLPGITVCGKTGTADNPGGIPHSWFVCFAPKDHPRIAMCVFVENAGYGGAIAAPIARELLKDFFNSDSAKASQPVPAIAKSTQNSNSKNNVGKLKN